MFYRSVLIVFTIFVAIQLSQSRKKRPKTALDYDNFTTCEEFSNSSRFNPYAVLNTWWFVFYTWGAPNTSRRLYRFFVPTTKGVKFLQTKMDGKTDVPVNWTSRLVIMMDSNNLTCLLYEYGDRGEYWLYHLNFYIPEGQKLRAIKLRIKQTGDNKLIGIMDCETNTLTVMCKINEIPAQKDLQDTANRIGFRSRRGRSYLYEGSEWMPIEEMDEHDFWLPRDLQIKREIEKLQGMDDEDHDEVSEEEDNVDEESLAQLEDIV